MNVLLMAWAALCCFVTVIWVRRHRDITCAGCGTRRLSSTMYDAPPDPAPRVSVIVAAKDEESVIERCVCSLLGQDYPNFELIVVNDRSRDNTGPLLDALQRDAAGRLRVFAVKELPAGWFGKPHAVRVGVASADGDYLLFSDADCEQTSTRTLSTAVRYAIENGIEFLSVLPVVKTSCFWEAVLQPVCTGVLMMWHNPEKVNNPKRSKAYANGAFMLIRRDAYERIGGHDRVRTALCEDMQLARNAKRAGVHLHIIQNRDLYTTRMYDSFAQVWRGWSRIFQGSLKRPSKLVLAGLVLCVFSAMPVITVAWSVVGLARSDSGPRWPWVVLLASSAAASLALQSVMFRFYRLLGASLWKSLLYAPAAVVCLGILADALRKVLGFGTTTWRGTTYEGRRVHGPTEAVASESAAHAG